MEFSLRALRALTRPISLVPSCPWRCCNRWNSPRSLTCDAGVQLQQRVQQHTLVELAQVVALVPSAAIEAPRAATSSFARWPATGWACSPGRTAARGQHPRLGRFAHRQLVLGELVLAHRLRRGGHAMLVTVMIVMMVQTVAGVQLALLVRLRMVPCGNKEPLSLVAFATSLLRN